MTFTEAHIQFNQDRLDRDLAPWELSIDTPDGVYERQADSPEALVRHARKWARDRGVNLVIQVTEHNARRTAAAPVQDPRVRRRQ